MTGNDAGSNQLVTQDPSGLATGVAIRMDAPTPGSYWRTRRDIKSASSKRRVCPALAEGLVLMLESIEHADGQPHVYEFASHPIWEHPAEVSIHADDFYTLFEPAPDGEAVRAGELAQLFRDMEQTQALMLTTPPKSAPAGLLEAGPPLGSEEPGTALATPNQVRDIANYAESIRADAEARSGWITKHSAVLAKQAGAIARFHSEQASAALASARSQLDGVASLLRTVENLNLYTGKGVWVTQLREGEPASSTAPLLIYQDLLALDEETAAVLDAGGLDHTMIDVLADSLADPMLIERMLPSERSIVLCRFRASDKVFFTGTDAGAAIGNAKMNMESQQHMLLLRDGRNIWLIQVPEVLQAIEQLLPSTREQDDYFTEHRYREAERITSSDLKYAAAQRRQMGALDAYGKVLIVLWGLRDRDEILPTSDIPHFSNWLDPAFQNRYLALLSHDTLLGESRETYRAWRARQNQYLAAGAWVAVQLRHAFNHETAPGAFGQGRYDSYYRRTVYNRIYEPKDRGSERNAEGVIYGRVKSDTKGLYIEIECSYDGYRSGKDRTIRLYVAQRRTGRADELTEGVLVLDRVMASDLDYYLTSRAERRQYADYLQLFRGARQWVAARDASERKLRDALREAVVAGGLQHDPSTLDSELSEALAIARTSRRSSTIPEPSTPAFTAFWRGALATLHARLVGNAERVTLIEQWAAAEGRTPIRLVLCGSGEFQLYAEPVESPREQAVLCGYNHAEVLRIAFDHGHVTLVSEGRRLVRPERGQHVIHDWTPAADWLKRSPRFSIDFEKAIAMCDLPAHARMPKILEVPPLEAVSRALRWSQANSKGQVRRLQATVPIGVGNDGQTPTVMFARIDAWHKLYADGDEKTRAAVRAAVESIYANPEQSLARLEKQAEWSLGITTLDHAWETRNDQSGLSLSFLTEERCRAKKKKGWDLPFQVQEVNAIGVELFPWLAGVTAAPTPVSQTG